MMATLVAAAEDLLRQAKELQQVLDQKNITPPTFDTDTLDNLPSDVTQLRNDFFDSIHSLRQLVRGARLAGLDIAFNWTDQAVLRAIWKYNIAAAVPLDSTATYEEVSTACGLSVPLLTRILRASIPLNLFDESPPGQIRHTAITRLLATDERYNSTVGLQVNDLGPASTKLLEAWESFGDAGAPDQSAFSLSHEGRSLFKLLAEDPDRASRFDSAMEYSSQSRELQFSNITHALDWSTLDQPGSQLLDLGGGHGQLSQALADHTHHLSFIVQDLPHVVAQGESLLPPKYQSRITFQPHDFLTPQSTPDNNKPQPPVFTILISRCLHNWSDPSATLILRNLIPALRRHHQSSRLLIWDSVLPDTPTHSMSARFNLQQDLIMATIANGKDRSAEEFERLLKGSDERYRVVGVHVPEESNLSLIEVVWDEEL